MATPTQPERRLLAAGAIKGATWGTAVALGAGYGVTIESDGGLARKQNYLPAKEADTPFIKEGDLGAVNAVDFNPPFAMRYDPGALGTIIALLFGTAGVPNAQFTITNANKYINFDEGAAELTGTVAVATYSGTTLATAIAAALNGAVGKALTYTCTYSASTRKFTIGAGANFTIRWMTGTNMATDISTLCGYSDAANDTGAASYASDTAVGTAYKHVVRWADSIYGNFVTFAVERPSKIYEVASAKPMGLDISVANGIIKGVINLRGDTVIDTSVINTATEVDALTYQDRYNRVKFTEASVKMNGQGDGNVASETALECSNISISMKRPCDAVFAAGGTKIIEPAESDHPAVTIKLDFPRMNTVNAAYLATLIAETEQKLLIAFTGATIESPHTYSWKFFFPRARIIDIQYPLNEVVPSSITLQVEEAAAAPTGMDYARMYMEIINTKTTDYLA